MGAVKTLLMEIADLREEDKICVQAMINALERLESARDILEASQEHFEVTNVTAQAAIQHVIDGLDRDSEFLKTLIKIYMEKE